ncbi:MAG TPA: hypothetical protein VM659_22450 [Dongiaceae bacterium]|nr:hypothetical protein [Dongiaceae bacterium]
MNQGACTPIAPVGEAKLADGASNSSADYARYRDMLAWMRERQVSSRAILLFYSLAGD